MNSAEWITPRGDAAARSENAVRHGPLGRPSWVQFPAAAAGDFARWQMPLVRRVRKKF